VISPTRYEKAYVRCLPRVYSFETIADFKFSYLEIILPHNDRIG